MSNIVTSGGNVAAKHSAQKEEGGDGLKTLECLRGRLLSERVASKAANVEAENLGNKLIELEEKLREETKGRNRAQKRLKSLIKKLESLNIVYVVSDESSSCSTSFGTSELSVSSSLSCSSSTASSFPYPNREPEVNEMKKPKSQIRKASKCELDELVMKNVSTVAEPLDHSDIHNASTEDHSFLSNDKISSDKTICVNSYNELRCTQLSDNMKRDDDRSNYLVEYRETDQESRQDWDKTSADDSMALVPVNIPATQTTITTIQPLIAENAGVEEVLGTLRYVKEELRSSMERRRMIRVGL